MSYLNEVLDDAAARIGGTRSEVRASLRPAVLTLEDAQKRGFDTIEEYSDAIREYAANCWTSVPRLTPGLFNCVLYIIQMYTVSYFEIYCDDGIPEATRQYFDTYQEAQAYAKSFEDWDDVRVDYVSLSNDPVPFWVTYPRLRGVYFCVFSLHFTND